MESSSRMAVASALKRARAGGQQVDAMGGDLVLPDCDSAYAVQTEMGRDLGWWTDVPLHWKTGAASLSAEQTSAPLPDVGVWLSPANATAWPMHKRGVEAEIAFRLARVVTPEEAAQLDVNQARALIDAMTVSIELVDFRWQQNMAAPDLLKLADLQSHGALVLGDWVPFAQRDWSAQVCRTWVGSQPEVMRQGTHSLGDPTLVLPRWLRHASRRFGSLAQGTVVTTGTWVGLLYASEGDLVRVAFDGIGECSVQV